MFIRQLKSLVTGVLIVAVLLPTGASIWFAHNQSHQQFQTEFDNYANRIKYRANRVVSQAQHALHALAESKLAPCSPPYLLALRQLTYSNRFIQEALYLDGALSRCSSLEDASQQPPFGQPDATTAKGYRYWYQAHNVPDERYQKVAIGYQNVVVLIDP